MALINAYFIDTTYILKYYSSLLDNNIDPNFLNTFIFIAQSENIQEILGYTLYNKYVTDIYNQTAITGDYVTLMETFIQPATSLWTIYHAFPHINFRATNKAISQKSSENSVPSTVSDVEYLRNSIKNRAEFATQRIREYIINNLNSFPEYSRSDGIGRIAPKSTIYSEGIALGLTNMNYRKNNDPYFGGPCCG